MEKLKEFFQDHKKIIIIVAVLVIIAIAGICIYLATRAKDTGSATSDDKQNEIQEAENQEDTSDETTDPSTSSAANGTGDGTADNTASATGENTGNDAASSQGSGDSSNSSAGNGKSNGKSGSQNTGSAGGTSSKSNGNSSSSSNSGSAHTHTWVDHTATKQVWVSHMVTVDDYGTVYGARFYVPDANGNLVSNGPTYWFENGFTQEDLKAIMKEGIRNADANGLYNGVYYGNYVNVQKTVKTGSHQEDQGHYETQTYVDYQYCSVCGARK